MDNASEAPPRVTSGDLGVLAWLVLRLLACLRPGRGTSNPYTRAQVARHLAIIGADSLPIVSVIAACTGIILALQSAQQLEKLGALSYVANLVAVTLVRELGPLLTAVIVTGRSGAAFAAEIASMQISEEIDALEVMGIEPVRFVVWPKFVGMLVMMPALTLWSDILGMTAGGAFSAFFLGIAPGTYLDQSISFLRMGDVWSGVVKSLGFGVTIALVGCWQGLLARQGAQDVGRRTTRAVVQSIFLIVLLDLFFTALNYLFR